MATISTSGIESGRIIRSAHVLRIIEALDGSETNDILISGSLITTGSVGVTGSVDVIGNITGSAFTGSFAGDGSNLTGVTGEWDGSHNGDSSITGSLTISGSGASVNLLNAEDGVSGSFSGSFVGDGSGITGVTGEWDGTRDGNAQITGSFEVSGSSTFSGSVDVSGSVTADNVFTHDLEARNGTLDVLYQDTFGFRFSLDSSPRISSLGGGIGFSSPITASFPISSSTINALNVSSSFSGSFQGDGSALTGITGEWDGSRDGNATITGSFNVSGSTGLTGSLDVSGSITGSNDIKVVGGIVSGISGSVIPFYFANQGAFPSATTYHGAIAHSHSDGAMYFAHGGAWNQLQNSSGPFSGSFSGSFQGDGSNLSGITGEWDGTRNGNSEITGSLIISGSDANIRVTGSVHISNILELAPIHPLPTDKPTGSLASSGSAGSVKPFFWDGTNWNALY